MKHYLVIGRIDGDNPLRWSGPEQSMEHAINCFRQEGWRLQGLEDDPEGQDASDSEGYGPYVDDVYVSDTPIRLMED